MTAQQIRQKFLDFFASKQHQIVPSAPIVVKNDPTLLFTNAGMNQFKDYFLGHSIPSHRRIADTQKCLRVSGKHNDLEEVGVDTYHHTMFEMLGNWSFGDYFKQESIDWAWELLTKEYGLDKDRLYVSVFAGDEKDGLEKDSDAFDFWKKHVAEDRIIFSGKKDNFWEMGDVGPCGPCSEIHVDLRSNEERAQIPGYQLVNNDHPQVIEIWNLVFIQFERKKDGSLVSLPDKHVDTGMGFERLTRAIQGKSSNYDTDVFMPFIKALETITRISYGQQEKQDIAFRVIADHIRAISFAIADGQLPSNTGAGYVIRRILRRAVRYAYSYLNLKEPFLHALVPVLEREMGAFFPELVKNKELVMNVIREEETQFLKTLERGIQLFQQKVQQDQQDLIAGDFAFELYDTFGFPIDLTSLMAREMGKKVDYKTFEACLEQQKSRSKNATKIETDDWVVLRELPETNFIGYDQLEASVQIAKYRKVMAKGESFYQLVFDQTPFYAESGGQVGDQGSLVSDSETIEISDTKKENNLWVHTVQHLPQNPSQNFLAKVDAAKRLNTQRHHSATHLLHHALRDVLGTHVEQKGSLVCDTYLRFDFSHFQKVTEQELKKVEALVNEQIWAYIPLQEDRNLPIEEAQKRGAMALFGEKYGKSVRVIQFGSSVELCGGTHVVNTAQIGLFKVSSESSVAAGVRRIEAVAGVQAFELLEGYKYSLDQIKQGLNNPKNVPQAIEELQQTLQTQKKELEQLYRWKAAQEKEQLLQKIQKIQDLEVIIQTVDLPLEWIKDLIFQLKQESKRVILLASQAQGKASVSVGVSDDLIALKGKYHAGNMVKELAKEIDGGGGGQASFATAGGKNPQGIPSLLEKAKNLIAS